MNRHQNTRGRSSGPLGYGHYARTMFPTNSLNFPATHRDIDYTDSYGYNKIFFAAHHGNLNFAHKLLKENSEEKELLGRTLVHVAAARGHEKIVILLCQRNFQIDKGDRDGNTPLHLAIKGNHIDVVQLLLKENTVNLTNTIKETPLHIATANSQIEIVELLLKNGANPNERDARGYSPLHLAVNRRKPSSKIVTLLVEHEASGNVICNAMQTPLYLAVSSGNIPVVKILVEHGARIGTFIKVEMSPLILAIQKNGTEIVRELLKTKFVDSEVTNTMTPLHFAARHGNQEIVKLLTTNGYNTINSKNEDSRTPLYFATVNGHLEIVKYLIEIGAKIESATPENESLLHYCARNGQTEMVKCLIDCGAVINVTNYELETPLHFAASKGHLDVVNHLLAANADVEAKTLKKETPLRLAMQAGQDKIVERLLEQASVDSLNSEDCSALTFAVKSRKKKIVELFLSKGARDLNADTESGERAFHIAAKNGDEDIIKLLLQAGCSLNVNCKGKKPIHVAAIFGQVKLIILLAKNGADINSRTRFEETPLHLAAASGRVATVKYLLNAGANPQLLSDQYSPPLEYALDRGRHMSIMQKGLDHSRRSETRNSGTNWSVNSVMFERYFDITEMLLIKRVSVQETNILHSMRERLSTCLNLACRIRVIKETCKWREGTTNLEFRPDILRCILNYTKDRNKQIFRSILTTAIEQTSPEVLKCLLEYDDHNSDSDIKIDCTFCDSKNVLIIIDHIEDKSFIYNLLFSSKVQEEVRKFREPSQRDAFSRTEIQRRLNRLRLLPLISITMGNLILNKNTYLATLKLLIARLVQLRAVSKEQGPPEPKEMQILADYGLNDWYTECEIQIMNARETKIHHDFDVTYYNFLSQSVGKISNYVRQKELLKIFEMSCMKFPAYGEFLKRSIEKGQERIELIDSSADSLLNVIKKNHKIQLPSLVVDKIFEYLNVVDLRRLQQAGRIVDKKPMYEKRKFSFEKNKASFMGKRSKK